MSDTPRTDAILALLPGGQSCDPQAVADDLRPEIARLERELEQERQAVAEWKRRIIPFLVVHGVNYGLERYGEQCLHYRHYDMLAEAGGRMDDFKRCGAPAEGNEPVTPQ